MLAFAKGGMISGDGRASIRCVSFSTGWLGPASGPLSGPHVKVCDGNGNLFSPLSLAAYAAWPRAACSGIPPGRQPAAKRLIALLMTSSLLQPLKVTLVMAGGLLQHIGGSRRCWQAWPWVACTDPLPARCWLQGCVLLAGVDPALFPRPVGDAREQALAARSGKFPENPDPRFMRLACNAVPAQQVS